MPLQIIVMREWDENSGVCVHEKLVCYNLHEWLVKLPFLNFGVNIFISRGCVWTMYSITVSEFGRGRL